MFHPNLTRFINDAILPLTSLDAAAFWKGFDDLINEFSGTRDLLADRLDLQAQIDHCTMPIRRSARQTMSSFYSR